MPAARPLIHAQVVDVERFDVRHVVVVHELLVDAERIAHNRAAALRNEHGRFVIRQNRLQLRVGVLLRARLEQIRTCLVMHLMHLKQQPVQRRNIGIHRPANHQFFHIILPLQLLIPQTDSGFATRPAAHPSAA